MRTTLLALVLTLAVLVAPAAAKNPLFVSNRDFAPYSMIIEGQPAGIDVEVMNEAAKRAGITYDLELLPFEEMITMVKKGTCDGAYALFHSPERERMAMFMDAVPVHYSDYVLFTKNGSDLVFTGYGDLKGRVIGRVEGTDLGKEFNEALAAKTFQVKEYPDLATGLRGLLTGEIDAYAGNIDVTYHSLKRMGMTSSIVYLPKKVLSLKPSYFIMSRTSDFPEKELLIQKLERALDQMRKDGTYNKIARRYLFRY
ncbi:transporter substrate-binding domain-containing protein [Pseudodesulfovibrio sp. zrk46]|uniref:substrate-binding periplasmic protein n=1 Tax=Pseudodesulfovibrio sp. zrk46 TaxID=2725288 RepID=UPI001449ECF7|nr:transporter substrate-binding domain-containing protein [Pseudodesulfovibrio sp. zrk46]QJB56074.1 amino acid ABC transporter substrate-binding protein [Pseudodesulfovibrio sp. zrk46]